MSTKKKNFLTSTLQISYINLKQMAHVLILEEKGLTGAVAALDLMLRKWVFYDTLLNIEGALFPLPPFFH